MKEEVFKLWEVMFQMRKFKLHLSQHNNKEEIANILLLKIQITVNNNSIDNLFISFQIQMDFQTKHKAQNQLHFLNEPTPNNNTMVGNNNNILINNKCNNINSKHLTINKECLQLVDLIMLHLQVKKQTNL